jgi:ParB family chromosome partitioning protein
MQSRSRQSIAKPSATVGKTVPAALKAATETFNEKPVLPLGKENGLVGGSLDGRRQLGGAFLIECTRIRPDPLQPRRTHDPHADEELTASVRKLGVLQPITVRFLEAENLFQIIAGERRFRAAKAADLIEVPCWVHSPKENQVLLHQIAENWQRLDVHPYDLADALARLRDTNGYSQRDLARETGKSEGEISKFLALLELDPAVQKVAREDRTGRITKRHLYAVRRLPAEEQASMIRRAQEEAITASDMELLAAKRTEVLTGRKPPAATVNQHCFQTGFATVTIKFRKDDVTTKDILAALDEVQLLVCRSRTKGTDQRGAPCELHGSPVRMQCGVSRGN